MLLFLSTLFACDSDTDTSFLDPNLLIGSWTNGVFDNEVKVYERSNSLVDNMYGFSFCENQVFVERKNSGWCGTPPVAYADYQGTWLLKDSILSIKVGFWGGEMEYRWRIVSLDKKHLSLISLAK